MFPLCTFALPIRRTQEQRADLPKERISSFCKCTAEPPRARGGIVLLLKVRLPGGENSPQNLDKTRKSQGCLNFTAVFQEAARPCKCYGHQAVPRNFNSNGSLATFLFHPLQKECVREFVRANLYYHPIAHGLKFSKGALNQSRMKNDHQ